MAGIPRAHKRNRLTGIALDVERDKAFCFAADFDRYMLWGPPGLGRSTLRLFQAVKPGVVEKGGTDPLLFGRQAGIPCFRRNGSDRRIELKLNRGFIDKCCVDKSDFLFPICIFRQV